MRQAAPILFLCAVFMVLLCMVTFQIASTFVLAERVGVFFGDSHAQR